MVKKYNKLVRDRIPEIIESDGRVPITRRLTGQDFALKLFEKLEEEHDELRVGQNVEEVADLIEVLFSIAHLYGYSEEQTLQLLYKKRALRGGFTKGLLLEEVHERSG